MTRRPRVTAFAIYLVSFHLIWIAWPYAVYPRLTAALGAQSFTYAAANLAIRVAVWVVPVLLYLRYVDRVDPFAYLKLEGHVARGVAVAAVLTIVNLIGMLWRFGVPHLHAARVTWNSVLGTSILVGIIEEIPYRGFILQKLCERVSFAAANLITSLLFVAIHVPGWAALHTFQASTAATIFIFSIVMGAALRYARSLWAPVIAHSANDFLSFIVFGL